VSDAQSLTLASPDTRPRWRKPSFPSPQFWWLWLLGCIVHSVAAITEFIGGRIIMSAQDVVLAAFWWLGLHAERAGDRHRSRALIFVIFAFDMMRQITEFHVLG
jgi:hypothetical protein